MSLFVTLFRPPPDGFLVGLLLHLCKCGVGLETWVGFSLSISGRAVGPAGVHLLLCPRVVVVLAELLDQSVQLIGQLHHASVDATDSSRRLENEMDSFEKKKLADIKVHTCIPMSVKR